MSQFQITRSNGYQMLSAGPNVDSSANEAGLSLAEEQILLSICIPTYQRRQQIVRFVKELLTIDGRFELCVHVDGSTDGTFEDLSEVGDQRFQVSCAGNQGRAGALISAYNRARGRFIMPFDDDDMLFPDGLQTILRDCASEIPSGIVGFIYHFEDEQGACLGDLFPVERTNFLALRADHKVKGDKKEVVLADAMRSVAYDSQGAFRRTPTSLVWSRLALENDVFCRNIVIGRKIYLQIGMTANIHALKSQNAYPQMLLYVAHLSGFARGRYRSLHYFTKALGAFVFWGARAATAALFSSARGIRA